MASLFFSYSHVDENLRDQLETQLAMLRRQGAIEVWHDRRIGAGDEFDPEIMQHVENDDIILLLVSPNFLASDYCYDREMLRAMERHEAGEETHHDCVALLEPANRRKEYIPNLGWVGLMPEVYLVDGEVGEPLYVG